MSNGIEARARRAAALAMAAVREGREFTVTPASDLDAMERAAGRTLPVESPEAFRQAFKGSRRPTDWANNAEFLANLDRIAAGKTRAG